ncbi:MAG: 2-amino-4-hydroxy-6-hydroxymethyldihydropteridine diphosphokinase, partial [Gammaproteobacteria bacterium]
MKAMRDVFGELIVSPVYESRAVGFEGENFLNLVVAFDTVLEPAAVVRELRGIEQRFGRVPGVPRFAPRTLD